VQGSPFELYVNPNLVNVAESSADGHGLSFLTAGTAAHFLVIERDDYANLRNDWRNTLVSFAHNLEPSGSGAIDPPGDLGKYGSLWHGSVSANVVPGTYHVAYSVTRAGLTRISASLVATGGLHATYYDSTATNGFENVPVMSRTTQQVSEGTAGGAEERGGPTRAHSVTGSGFTVRWSGLFRPQFAAVYTFQTRTLNMSATSGNTERMRLWVDNQLIIDQWVSLSTGDASPVGVHAFPAAFDYYQLELLYQSHSMRQLTVELLGSPDMPLQSLPSSNLLSAMPVGGPWTIRAQPSGTDLDSSDVYGGMLTLSTAGVASSFIIVARDTFGNQRAEGGDALSMQASDSRVSIFGEVLDLGSGSYRVQYLPEVAGSYELKVYMGSNSKRFTLFVHPGDPNALDFELVGALTIATAGYAATFTIQAKDSFGNLRSLGDDVFNLELVGPLHSSSSNPPSSPTPSGGGEQRHLLRTKYLGVLPASNLARHTAAFRVTYSGDYYLHVRHASANGLNATFFSDSQLKDASVVRVEPAVDYNWGSDSPYAEAGTSNEWSARWKGLLQSQHSEVHTFQASIAEEDERVKLWIHDEIIIDQWSSLSSVAPSGTIWLASGGVSGVTLEYSAKTGLSAVSLKWKSTSQPLAAIASQSLFSLPQHVKGSPFAITVYPAGICGATSTARGDGLSLATAGTSATFSIIARDHFGNLRGASADDTYVVRVRHGSDYLRRDIHAFISLDSSATLPPHLPSSPWLPPQEGGSNGAGLARTDMGMGGGGGGMAAQGVYKVEYRPEWKRSLLSVRGSDTDTSNTHTVPPLDTSASRPLHDLTVELAVGGALMATYYSFLDSSGEISDSGVDSVWGQPSRTFLRHNLFDSEQHANLHGDERGMCMCVRVTV
jgi:hypothetical protein